MTLTSMKVIKFKTEFARDPETKKNTREVDWVLLTNLSKHRQSETWHRVKDMLPKEDFNPDTDNLRTTEMQKFFQKRWDHIRPHYENFKKGTKTDIEGTLLASWPFLSEAEVQALNRGGLHTVEELAALSDSAVGRVHLPDMRGKIREAKKFLENSDKVALLDRLAELEAKIAQKMSEPSEPAKAAQEASETVTETKPKPTRSTKPKTTQSKGRPRQTAA